MTVVLKDIDLKKRITNNYGEINIEMYDLATYRNIAKKCISKFSGASLAPRMIRDEDAISHVAEHVMWGHLRWKEDGGRALKSYLNQCAIWAIKSWKTKIYKGEQKKIDSLDYSYPSAGEDGADQYNFVPDKSAKEPFDEIFNSSAKEARQLIDSECLTSLQRSCLTQRYVEGKKLRQIAEVLGVTRQAVNQHIKKAISKLKESNGIC
tara:strand:- start:1282 stop:1905 length:624 start_codon:yes stop_codon:yes gene_type:complete